MLAGAAAKGPYPALVVRLLLRIAQRYLVNRTKEVQGKQWHPLNDFGVTLKRTQDNGHAVAGAARDSARVYIDQAVQNSGYRKYELSPYASSWRQASYSPHFAPADLMNELKKDRIESDMVIVGIDVDYYVEDWSWVLGRNNPSVWYTFQPFEVAGLDGDTPFRIENDVVMYDVSGGTGWRHKVWNWSVAGEFIRIRDNSWVWWFAGFAGLEKLYYHKVCHARPWSDCPHRMVVWTIPIASHWAFNWIELEIGARELDRLRFSDTRRPGWNQVVTLTERNELMVSIGRQGEDNAVSLKKTDLDVLLGLQSAQSVTSRMIGMGYKDQRLLATVGQYYRGGLSERCDAERLLRPAAVQVHWPSAFEADAPDVSSRPYAVPLVTDENVMPMIRRWEALSGSLDNRVTFVRNETVPGRQMQAFAREFVALVVPDDYLGVGVPYSLERVVEELSKPSQVLGIKQVWETVEMEPRRLIESFVKNEPCMKDGRIISSFPDFRFLARFSAFTLRCRDDVFHSEHMRHWFLPGSTPREIASRVQEYVGGIDVPAETDFSNFDGTVSRWMQRNVMNACYARYFHRDYQKELQPYLDMLVSCPARAKRFGFRYDAGPGVKSGAPTTCDLNTIADAFVEYAAIRKTCPDLEPQLVMRMIGPKFGDDGLTDARFVRGIDWAVRQLGLKVKVEKYTPENGLVFLARVFPDPWGSLTSYQDPIRTWRKLHITSRDVNIPLASAAVDRLEGYMVTDGLTPITSDYATMVMKYYEVEAARDEKRSQRKSRDKEKPYWLTNGGAWPQAKEDEELMEKSISTRVGLPLEELREWRNRIKACKEAWAANITLDRELVTDPRQRTLDEEGLPVEGPVDVREFEMRQDVQRNRANPETSGAGGDSHSCRGAERERSAPTPNARRDKGSRQLPRVSGKPVRESGEGNEGAAGEASSEGVSGGGESRSAAAGPIARDRTAPRRGGQVGNRNSRSGRPHAGRVWRRGRDPQRPSQG